MTGLEVIGLIGSIASIVSTIPICIACFKYIRGKHLYNKMSKGNLNFLMSLTTSYRKANPKKRQHYREQAKKLKEDIGQVPKDKLNLGLLYESLMNMVDNMERLDKKSDKQC